MIQRSLNLDEATEGRPKVKIGEAYQPERFETRGNNGHFQSFRGYPDRDAVLLQAGLLRRNRRGGWFCRATPVVALVATIAMTILAGGNS